jgi:predicted nucleic acid-binding protein
MTLSWCFEDEVSPAGQSVLERLADDVAITPAVWSSEVANGLRSAERRGRIGESELPGVAQLLRSLPIRTEELPLRRALADVLPLARALAISAYDASYIELAQRNGVPLATADDALASAAVAAGVDLLDT